MATNNSRGRQNLPQTGHTVFTMQNLRTSPLLRPIEGILHAFLMPLCNTRVFKSRYSGAAFVKNNAFATGLVAPLQAILGKLVNVLLQGWFNHGSPACDRLADLAVFTEICASLKPTRPQHGTAGWISHPSTTGAGQTLGGEVSRCGDHHERLCPAFGASCLR